MRAYSTVLGAGNRTRARRILRTAAAWAVAGSALGLGWVWPGASSAAESQRRVAESQSQVLRLSLDEAMALFLRQNLHLVRAKYGIDEWKGRQITARLFPNPTFSINTFSAYTQKCTLTECGAVTPMLSQLFLVAGKRGFRIESAELGTRSAEAMFEDTIRQLSYAVKDAYFRVQRANGHLAVDRERLASVAQLLAVDGREQARPISQQERVRLRMRSVSLETEIVEDIYNVYLAGYDLHVLLGLPPDREIHLTTEATYKHLDVDLPALREKALENRPDIRAKRLLHRQRQAEFRLAKAIQYPDLTVDLGYMMQGPTGPDNQQQWALNFSAPLPVFDRNQGGIVTAGAAVQAAGAEYQERVVQVQNEVDTASRGFLESQKLVEVFHRMEILKQARGLYRMVTQAYKTGEIGVLELNDVDRASKDVEERYIEALFGYQRQLLLLEKAVGQEIPGGTS